MKDEPRLVQNLALDRFLNVKLVSDAEDIPRQNLNPENYYRHVISVTVSDKLRTTDVKLFASTLHAPYGETKPLYPSQRVLERRNDGIVILVSVQFNFKLEKETLGLGECMAVLAPEWFRNSLKQQFMLALA